MSGKRLPQAGEMWFRGDGLLRGPLFALEPQLSGRTLGASPGCHYMPDGRICENDIAIVNLVLIHKDASGKVIHATFDPSLIGKDEAETPAKPTPPGPLAQAIAAADDQAKGLRDRQAKAQAVKANAEAGKALRAELAALVAKYPIPGDKAKPKARKNGRG